MAGRWPPEKKWKGRGVGIAGGGAGMVESGASMKLIWSQHLEALAERLFRDLEVCRGEDPLARSAVVVSHALRGQWLKEWHLFSREGAGREILAGIDVLPLHPFTGDWLHAALEGQDPKSRRPSSHPYSMEVLRWRIDGVMAGAAAGTADAEARSKKEEVRSGGGDGWVGAGGVWAFFEGGAERRSAVAGKLAEMFSDYQSHRPEMLARWERGELRDGEPEWQMALWNALREQGGTPLKDLFLRVGRGADLSRAFEHGIPRYRSVHVFGVSSMPRPYAAFFGRLGETLPVTVYAFNPSEAFWFDDPGWKRARHIVLEEERLAAFRAVDGALEAGETPDAEALRERMAELSHPLLGTLARGCQGLLAHLLDRLEGEYECLTAADGEADTVLARLQRQLRERADDDERGDPVAEGEASIRLHKASTPQREMEVLRDGLLEWFAGHPEAHPRDVLVLCGDWETYAPCATAVFGGAAGDGAALPCTFLGRGAADDPIAASFLALLELAKGRMEAESVLDVLAEPAVAAKFGVGAEDFPVLRKFVRDANIRWGLDDAHVEEIMAEAGEEGNGAEPAGGPHAFTWRRGLDRLLLSALSGVEEGDDGITEAGALGAIRPTGDAETARAGLLGRLEAFVGRLAALRGLRGAEGTADFWQEAFSGAIGDFYKETDETSRSIGALREAVAAVAARIRDADAMAGRASRHPFGVVAGAVAEYVGNAAPHAPRTPDAVLFAPLRAGIPSPRRLVWICGLNDGAFPRNVRRPACDLLGAHPAPLDPSPRDDDALALLEAVCSARETLVLSHVGVDARTGEEIPPAPLAGALLDYVGARFAVADGRAPVETFRHPLQGFSPRYFTRAADGKAALPPSRSGANRDAARAIAKRAADGTEGRRAEPFAFLGEERESVGLVELAEAFASPCRKVLRTFAWMTDPERDAVDSNDALETAVDATGLSFIRELPEEKARRLGQAAVETGQSPNPETAAETIRNAWESADRKHFRERPLTADVCKVPPVPGEDNILGMKEDAETVPISAEVVVAGRPLRVEGSLAAARRRTVDGGEGWFRVVVTRHIGKPWQMAEDWIRHLAANASGLRMTTVTASGTATLAKGKYSTSKEEIQVLPPMERDAAAARLGAIAGLLCRPFPGAVPFHAAVSYELAGKGKGAVTASMGEAERRAVVRKNLLEAWFGYNEARAEEKLLWPESPAVLADEWIDAFADAAGTFWEGFPYLVRAKKGKKS